MVSNANSTGALGWLFQVFIVAGLGWTALRFYFDIPSVLDVIDALRR